MIVIINLIIVLVIIISVLKRITDVANQSKNLEKSPVSKEKGSNHEVEEWIRQFQNKPQPVLVPPQPVESVIPEAHSIHHEDSFKMDIEEQFDREPVVPDYEFTSQTAVSGHYQETAPSEVILRFNGPEVVRGIIMSELLGPPVSMRDDRFQF